MCTVTSYLDSTTFGHPNAGATVLPTRAMSPFLRLMLTVSLTSIACGGASKPPNGAVDPAPASPTGPQPPAEKPAADPGPTAEQSLEWILSVIAAGKAEPSEVEARFSKAFLSEVPPAKFLEITAQLTAQLPPIKVAKKEGTAPLELRAILDTAAGGVRVIIGMTRTEPRKIETLLFQPASTETPPKTYGEAVAQLQQAGSTPSLLVAQVNANGACKIHQPYDPGKRLAIGSTFKLWVLLATEAKIAASKGKLTWDSKIAIRDELKSLPSGVLQDKPAGTELTLREFAERMISISDNTATDHLIAFAGRANVEKQLRATRHSSVLANVPFMTTRELFAVKLLAADDELAALRKSRGNARVKLLEALAGRPLSLEAVKAQVEAWKGPKHLDLEWFASATDLCNAMGTLAVRAKFDPESELLKTLSKNPGLELDKSQWRYIGFKGGSEPGVMNLTHLLQRKDGKWFVVSATVNDDQKPVQEGVVVTAVTGVIQLLAAEK